MKTWTLVVFAWLLVGALSTMALAIKKHPVTCEDEVERLRTDLRLRTAELEVARGQFRAAERRLELCQGRDP